MKTRKKIVVVVVALSLLLGIGSAFAESNAGKQLQDWYDAMFNKSFARVETAAREHGNQKFWELFNWWNNTEKPRIQAIVNGSGNTEISRASTEISNALNGHLEAITDKKDEIIDGMSNKYKDEVVDVAKGEIDTLKEDSMAAAKPIAKDAVDGFGSAALAKVDLEVNSQKTNAENALKLAIKTAKDDINGEIDEEEIAATSDITKYIDDEVVEAQSELTTYVNGLAKGHMTLITNKGKDIEAEAKLALDGIVAGITDPEPVE